VEASGGFSRVTRGAATVGAATLVSRITGFLRDIAIANFFGAAGATDAFFVAFRIPNMFRRLLGEGRGSLTSAFVPIFADSLESEDRTAARRFLATTSGWLLLLLAAVCLLGVAFSPALISIFSPGFRADPGKFALAVSLNRIMFPYLLFISLVALFMGVLNTLGRFFAPAIAPVLLNLSLIAAAFLGRRLGVPIFALAIAVIVAGFLQLLLQLPFLRAKGFLVTPKLGGITDEHRRLAKLMLPAFLGFGVYSVSILITPAIGSMLEEGAISFLYYADRLVQFPLAIIGISFATAIFPSLARSAARSDESAFLSTLSAGVRWLLFLSIPAAVGLAVLAKPIVQVLFERGRFTPDATAATAGALVAYSAGLVAFAVVQMLLRAFYAAKDLWTPLASEVFAVLAFLLLSVTLVGPLASPPSPAAGRVFDKLHILSLGHVGIAAAFSASTYLQTCLLLALLKRKRGGFKASALIAPLVKMLFAATVMGALLKLGLHFFPNRGKMSIGAQGGSLVMLVLGGCAVYECVSLAIGTGEAKEVWAGLAGRLKSWTRKGSNG